MNNPQKLFITPEEHARRMATEQRSRHQHGGEGRCGGTEGHGTPELKRRSNGGARISMTTTDMPGKSLLSPSVDDSTKVSNISNNKTVAVSREQVISAIRLSFALGEPACRRYGLGSPFVRKQK